MIETKDLILDKAKLEDWRAMYRNVWSRPESFRYMVLELTTDEEEARERMRRTIEFQKSHEAYTVFLRSTGEAIGFAGVEEMEPGAWGETGICLGPDFTGQGYGTQILEALLAYAKALGAREFRYSAWEENEASRALAERFGFQRVASEAYTREHDGRRYTLVRYRLELT